MAVGVYPKIHRLNLTKPMALKLEELKEAIKAPKKTKVINKAKAHQARIKMHVQTEVTPYISQPLAEFFNWVGSLIPKDKAKIFKQLFRYPIATNEVTGIVFDRLSRVFDGRNPVMNYQFMTSEQRDDWEYYRQEILKEPTVWNTTGWENFKTEINSVLIVDLPAVQDPADKYPQPYFYWLPIDQVITYQVNPSTGIMDWIVFKQPGNKIAVFDDESFRIFGMDKNKMINETPEVNNPHDLGYCPARFFWNQSLSLSEPDVKIHPLSKSLANLDWLLFFHFSKHHLDLYGAYPIYSGYAQNCNFENSENGDQCDGGFLKNKEGNFIMTADGLARCPRCGEKRIAGVGSFVEVPIPGKDPSGYEIPDLKNPVQMLGSDVQSLEYNVKEETRLRESIITSVCGVDNEVVNDQAINESQVDATFESQSTILNRIKKGFEEAQTFVDSTICRLRYGKLFISGNINLGTEFYTLTPQALRNQYKTAKDAGASEAELDALQKQIIETEYRHNPTELQRMIILADLEPYRHFSRTEVLDLKTKNLINDVDLLVKLNFSNFVRRFERENTNILEFGVNIPYDRKIDIINEKFKEYANEIRPGPTNPQIVG